MSEIITKDAAGWQSWKDNNQDPYGAGVVRFAERWAVLMQEELAAGNALTLVAGPTSRIADTEGITGFMYGCAVQMLVGCWIHGEELRRWHNVDTQIDTEGERANEAGGVLNPALLNISTD